MEISKIDINSIPLTDKIDLNDKIYIFKERDRKYFLEKVNISELSSFLYSKEFVDKFNQKYNELLELSSNFVAYLRDTFPTLEYIENTFATTEYFNSKYDELQHKANVEENILNNYLTRKANEKRKQTAFREIEELKNTRLNSDATSIVARIPYV